MTIDYESPLPTGNRLIGKSKPTIQGRRRHRDKQPSLEEALELLQSLGFSVVVPTAASDKAMQQDSRAALGFTDVAEVVAIPSGLILHGYLNACHIVAGTSYGPGKFSLPGNQTDLYRSLLQADQACTKGHMDTTQYNTVSRCFIIKPGDGRDKYHKYAKLEVSEAVFNSNQFIDNVSVTAGAIDAAGYNPSFGQENRTF